MLVSCLIKNRRKPTGFSHRCKCEQCRLNRNAAQVRYRKAHPDRIKTSNLKRFGLSHSQWRQMVTASGDRCYACREKEKWCNVYGLMSLAVDHDHETGRVRGLLCHRCNRALGMLQDSSKRLEQLLSYRRSYP